MPSCKGSSQPRDQTQVFHAAGKFFTIWATGEAWCYVISRSNTRSWSKFILCFKSSGQHTHFVTTGTRAKFTLINLNFLETKQNSPTNIYLGRRITFFSTGKLSVLKRKASLIAKISLIVQWLRTCLATQATWVQFLAGGLRFPTLRPKKKTKPAHYNNWTHSPQLESQRISTKDPTRRHKDLACHN